MADTAQPFRIWIRRTDESVAPFALRFEVFDGKGILRVARPGILIDPPARVSGFEDALGADQIRASRFLHVWGGGRRRQSHILSRLDEGVLQALPRGTWSELAVTTEGGYRYLMLGAAAPEKPVEPTEATQVRGLGPKEVTNEAPAPKPVVPPTEVPNQPLPPQPAKPVEPAPRAEVPKPASSTQGEVVVVPPMVAESAPPEDVPEPLAQHNDLPEPQGDPDTFETTIGTVFSDLTLPPTTLLVRMLRREVEQHRLQNLELQNQLKDLQRQLSTD